MKLLIKVEYQNKLDTSINITCCNIFSFKLFWLRQPIWVNSCCKIHVTTKQYAFLSCGISNHFLIHFIDTLTHDYFLFLVAICKIE